MRPFDRTKRHDEWQVSRWTHPPAKRSGRYTKPGYRPRAGRKADYLAARQKIRNETLVEKADRAMRSIYNTAPTGETSIIVNSGFLNYTNPFLNETTGGDYLPTIGDVNPRIYLPGRTEATFTTSTNVTYNTPLYLGVDHGVTDSTTSWTISTGNNLSVQAWPQRVSYDEDGNQEVTWLTESVRAWQDMGRAAAQAGQAMGGVVDAFRDAANAVGNAGTAFTNQFRIVVNPNMPPDQIAWTYGQDYVFADVPLSRRQRLRQQMQPQRDPCRADGVSFQNCSPAEITALTLLKKMVDSEGWRKYLKYGFVNVKGQSGLSYQIRRGQWHVLVWNPQGKKVAELCVGLSERASMPPTDEVIARMIMAECDEPELWRRANVDTEGMGQHALYSVNGRRAWMRHHASPENHKVLERLSAVA